MKANALIVDDEYSGRISLQILLQKHFDHLFSNIVTASSVEEAVARLSRESFQLCFLDIELQHQSGFDILPHVEPSAKIVFVTAYSQYAIQAIKQRAFDYLLKPLNPIELKLCVQRFEKEVLGGGIGKCHLIVKDKGLSKPLSFSVIEYLQADGPYSRIFSIHKMQYTTARTLKHLTALLGDDFIRVHKSYLVNKTMVQSFNKDSLITTYHTCLPVSRIGGKELSRHF